MKAIVVFLFSLFTLIFGCDGKGDERAFNIRNKRSDGLIRELLHQIVSEHLERRKILKEFQAIKTKLDDVKTAHLKLRNTFSNDVILLNKKLLRVIKEVKATSKASLKSQDSHWKQIAFSAQLSYNINTSSTLVFKRVLTNIGGGYNVSDGKFYCPQNGLYLFSVTLEGSKRFNVWADLKKNDIYLAHLHERGAADGYPSVSVTVAVQLVIGDQVWVKGVGIVYRFTSHFTGVYVGP